MSEKNYFVDIMLVSISPICFALAKEGDLLVIREKKPKANEFRHSIGAPTQSFLVFKGNTKIGMLPPVIVDKVGRDKVGNRCRIVRMSKPDNVIVVSLLVSKTDDLYSW